MWEILPNITTLLLVAILANVVQSRLRYIRPRKTYPVTTARFGLGGATGTSGTYVFVQKKADLTKWRQTIDGIPVFGSVITTQSDENGNVTMVEGYEGEPFTSVTTTPSLTAADAIASLKKLWKHSHMREAHFSFEDPELFIFKSDALDKLVWKISYFVYWRGKPEYGFGPVPAYIIGLVNAHSGKVERTWNNIHHAKVKAITGNKKIGKRYVDIDVDKKGSHCWHVDEYRHIEVRDMRNHIDFTNYTTQFRCEDAVKKEWDSFTRTGSFSPRNEAFMNAVKYVDMWRKLVGKEITPYKAGLGLNLLVHYDEDDDNAAFMYKAVVFGDGGHLTYPMTTLDIVCHELAHGITAWKGGEMVYEGEPGAISEAYSDIVGSTCNIYYNNVTDFLIGKEIMKPGTDEALRDMCRPSRFGGLENYKEYASLVKDGVNVNVHSSSGIYNKAWCLLTKTKGWDYIMTFNIFTDANLFCWNFNINMHCGACNVESRAEHRGYRKEDVTAAFKQVGVHCSKCNL